MSWKISDVLPTQVVQIYLYTKKKASYPVGIEFLHGSDHTILGWRRAVAAFAGGVQDKGMTCSVFTYGWNAEAMKECDTVSHMG